MCAISMEKLAEGFTCALDNAERLLNDAKILSERACYASSIQLSLLSVEEAGKASMLREHLLHQKEVLKSEWRIRGAFFKMHSKKFYKAHDEVAKMALNWLQEVGASHLMDSKTELDKYETQDKSESLKQRVTYLDYDFEKKCWLKPWDTNYANARFAKTLCLYAKIIIKAIRSLNKD